MVYPDLKTARFNLRAACKELVLLEVHLKDPQQRCPDCIVKHALTFEALIDEARGLDGAHSYTRLIDDLAGFSSDLNDAIRAGTEPASIAYNVRLQRKPLQAVIF